MGFLMPRDLSLAKGINSCFWTARADFSVKSFVMYQCFRLYSMPGVMYLDHSRFLGAFLVKLPELFKLKISESNILNNFLKIIS